MYYSHASNWGPGAWIAMASMMLVFWGVVAAAIVLAVRSLRPHDKTSTTAGDAIRILDERFARGEIDADEYRQRRDLLRSS